MTTQSEMWIAYARDQLTSTVSLCTPGNTSLIKVTMSGIMDAQSAFITNTIAAMIEGRACNCAVIDVANLVFREGMQINESAIECLIRLTEIVMKQGIDASLIIEDAYVREILTDILNKQKCLSRLMICSEQDFIESESVAG